MDKFFSWYLWYPLLLILFEAMLVSQKKRYVMERGLTYDDAYEFRVKTWFAIIVFLPLIFISAYRGFNMGDTAAYHDMFYSWPEKISDINLTGDERYPGFIYFTVFIKQFISYDYQIYFMIIAAISVLCMISTYKKYTSELVFVAYGFFCLDFQSWLNNGIRQFLVVSIMFAFIPILLNKKKFGIIVFVLIGLLLYYTHVSIIVALPVYICSLGKPMNKRTIMILGVLVLAIIFVGQFTGILSDTLEGTNYESSTSEITSTTNGTNILRVLFFSIPAILCIVFRKRIPEDAPSIINYSINMSLVGAAFYWLSAFTNGISVGRMPIYFTLFNYILVPWQIRTFFSKEKQTIMYFFFIITYFVFYLYQQRVWFS